MPVGKYVPWEALYDGCSYRKNEPADFEELKLFCAGKAFIDPATAKVIVGHEHGEPGVSQIVEPGDVVFRNNAGHIVVVSGADWENKFAWVTI